MNAVVIDYVCTIKANTELVSTHFHQLVNGTEADRHNSPQRLWQHRQVYNTMKFAVNLTCNFPCETTATEWLKMTESRTDLESIQMH